jgi:hypothetical protein
MFRQSIRRFGTTALRAAAESSYTAQVSTAQGVVNGLTEGMLSSGRPPDDTNLINFHLRSNWKHPFDSLEASLRRNGV